MLLSHLSVSFNFLLLTPPLYSVLAMLYSFCHSNMSYFPYNPFFSALFELCDLSLRLEKHLLMLLCILVHCHGSLGL